MSDPNGWPSRPGVPQQLIPTAQELQAQAEAEGQAQQQAQMMQSPVMAQVAGAVAGGAMREAAA
jgi:hypothetical protein